MAGISKAERERRAAEAAADTQPNAAEAAADTVQMVRGTEFPAPHAADVHPDEVENFAAGGWVLKA